MTDQLDLFNLEDKPNSPLVLLQDGEIESYETFFDRKESDRLLDLLKETIDWKQESMQMYGKQVAFPRLTAWYGDNDKPYKFSGITLSPNNWTKELLEIKNKIEPIAGVTFNSVLLNRYRDGNDSISWHTDAEPELGTNPIIASVNFGAKRRFMLRHINNHGLKYEVDLKHGSFLLMKGSLQHFWQHQVPKTKENIGERINLTFRVIKNK